MTAEFSIPVSTLDAAGKPFDFPIRAAWLRGTLEGEEATATGEDGRISGRVSKSGDDVVVAGTLEASLVVPCARCLEPVKLPISEPIGVLFVQGGGAPSGDPDAELSADDADTMPFVGDNVELDELVRDELLLAIPMIPLCSDDCAGITPPFASGASGTSGEAEPEAKPIDPRLAPLLKIKPKQ